jgi:diadenosine tetraphosphate (Ap4A) HIT family hydrolase
MVGPRRHVADWSDLDDQEAADLGVEVARWVRALKTLGPRRVYTATIGHGVAHLHVHLLARWPGTPEDVNWHQIDSYPKARRADFAELCELVDELRAHDTGSLAT